MHGAIPPLLQNISTAWCLAKWVLRLHDVALI